MLGIESISISSVFSGDAAESEVVECVTDERTFHPFHGDSCADLAYSTEAELADQLVDAPTTEESTEDARVSDKLNQAANNCNHLGSDCRGFIYTGDDDDVLYLTEKPEYAGSLVTDPTVTNLCYLRPPEDGQLCHENCVEVTTLSDEELQALGELDDLGDGEDGDDTDAETEADWTFTCSMV